MKMAYQKKGQISLSSVGIKPRKITYDYQIVKKQASLKQKWRMSE